MAGVFLWAWDDSISEWIKVAVDPTGKLEVAGVDFPVDYPLPAAQVVDLKKITEAPDPEISQPTPENLNHVPHGYYATGGVYKPLAVDVDGKLLMLSTPTAHKDTHDPEDGADPLDTAAPVKVGAANAIGNSHSFSRANHVHEREHAKYTNAEAVTAMGVLGDGNPLNHDRAAEWGAAEHTAIGDAAPHHAKYTDAEAKAAAVQAGAITNAVTKAPTHDAVFDVKATADAAMPSADDAAAAVTAMGAKAAGNPLHHDKYLDAAAVAAVHSSSCLLI